MLNLRPETEGKVALFSSSLEVASFPASVWVTELKGKGVAVARPTTDNKRIWSIFMMTELHQE
jgi:hypothetical protein